MKKGPLLKILFISVLYFICIIFVFRLPLMGLGRILYTPIFNLGYDSSNWDFILKTNLGIFSPRITIFLMKYFSNLASLRILAFLVHGINTLLFLLILQQFNIKKYLASASIFYLFFPLHLWQCISPEYLPLLICGLLALSSFALYAEYLRKQKNYFLLLSFLVFFVCLSLSKIFFFLPFVFIFLSFYPQYFSKNNLVKSSLKLNIIKLLPFIFVIFSQWPLLNFDISNRSNDWTFYMEDIEHSKLLQLYYHLNTDKTSSLSNELKLFLSNNKLHHSSLNKISLNFYKHFQYFEFFQFIEAKNFKEKLGLLPSVKLFYLCSIIYLMGILFLPFVISLLQKIPSTEKIIFCALPIIFLFLFSFVSLYLSLTKNSFLKNKKQIEISNIIEQFERGQFLESLNTVDKVINQSRDKNEIYGDFQLIRFFEVRALLNLIRFDNAPTNP